MALEHHAALATNAIVDTATLPIPTTRTVDAVLFTIVPLATVTVSACRISDLFFLKGAWTNTSIFCFFFFSRHILTGDCSSCDSGYYLSGGSCYFSGTYSYQLPDGSTCTSDSDCESANCENFECKSLVS